MSDTVTEKVYCYDHPSAYLKDNSALCWAALMNNNKDNNLLETAALMNGGGFGGFNNNPFVYLVWMWMMRWMNGGDGFGGDNYNSRAISQLQDTVNTNHNNDLVLQGINGNAAAISELANAFGTNNAIMQGAINDVRGAIDRVAAQSGITGERVINSVLMGNKDMQAQISQCCCDNKLLVTQLGYENRIATLNLTNALENAINRNTVNQLEGFTTVTFQNQTQQAATQRAISDGVQSLKDATNSLTSSIIAKLDAIEDARKDREINSLTAQLASVTAKAEREAELAPIVKQLDAIQCKLPSTVTTSYSPFVAVPNCVAYLGLYNAMQYGLNPIGSGSIWS